MKSFKNCPCCGDPLLNDAVRDNQLLTESFRRSCLKHLDHKFTTLVDPNKDEVVAMGIEVDPKEMVRFQWNFKKKVAFVAKGLPKQAEKNAVYLPYFEPDLSDYHRLVAKLRTYLTFS